MIITNKEIIHVAIMNYQTMMTNTI